jgi:hypothetical protein
MMAHSLFLKILSPRTGCHPKLETVVNANDLPDGERAERFGEMRLHLRSYVSPTAHRGYTWEQWKMLSEFAARID